MNYNLRKNPSSRGEIDLTCTKTSNFALDFNIFYILCIDYFYL